MKDYWELSIAPDFQMYLLKIQNDDSNKEN